MKVALIGNPNSGKTTLFNTLTGSSARVGNWPGVTVDKKEGMYKKDGRNDYIIDLPGIYSLSPYTNEEVVARDYLLNEEVDVIINIVDCTNLERNLYLTTQLLELDKPVVVALNMMDLAKSNGISVDLKKLSGILKTPVVSISALKNTNIKELMDEASTVTNRDAMNIFKDTILAETIEKCCRLFNSDEHHVLFKTIKILEKDEKMVKDYSSIIEKQEEYLNEAIDYESEIANLRYQFISDNCSSAITKKRQLGDLSQSDKIDQIITNKFLGIPIFLVIMFAIFHFTFAENFLNLGIPSPGVYLQGLTEVPIEWLSNLLTDFFTNQNASPWVFGLVIDGIIGGVGAVLSFIPQILCLLLGLTILEDSGYMARAAFIMDRILRKFGLSGKAFLPLLMGFGCSVPAMMGTRTLENEGDRRLTMMLIPYMSCGAKAPIWALFASAVFTDNGDLMTFGIYFLGIFVAIISAILLKKLVFKGQVAPFIMELPQYHIPSFKNISIHLWDKLKGYVVRAGTVILAATIVLWFFANFDFTLSMTEPNSANSILGVLANSIKFIFIPLGFASGPDGWKAVVAILTGLIAKEAVVSTMGLLYTGVESSSDFLEKDSGTTALYATIASTFSPIAAFSFMAFNLLSIPCMAAVAALRAELNSRKYFWGTLAMWVSVAWVVSFTIYNVVGPLIEVVSKSI